MSKKKARSKKSPKPDATIDGLVNLIEKSQKNFTKFLASPRQTITGLLDPFNVVGPFARSARQLALQSGQAGESEP